MICIFRPVVWTGAWTCHLTISQILNKSTKSSKNQNKPTQLPVQTTFRIMQYCWNSGTCASIPKKIIEWDPSIQMWQLLLWKTFQKYFPSGLEIPKAHSGLNCENKFNFGNSQIKPNIVFKNNFELGSLKGTYDEVKKKLHFSAHSDVDWK